MFTDQYMKQRAAQASNSPNSLKRPSNGKYTQYSSSRPLPFQQGASTLSCKSKTSLSRAQSLPPKLRNQSSPKRTPDPKTAPSRSTRLRQGYRQQSVLSQQNVHGMPAVLKSTKPPIVYSPQQSPSMPRSKTKSKTNVRSTTLPSVLYKESNDFRRSLEKKLSSLAQSRERSLESVLSRQVSVPSSLGSDISGAMDSMSLESSYSYVYDSVTGSRRRLSRRASSQSSSEDRTAVSLSRSSGDRTESWRKMAHTMCMGEGIVLEGEDDYSFDHSGLDSVEDTESYPDSYGQEAELDDDLTDLDSDEDRESCDSRLSSMLSTGDPVTLVGREMSRDKVAGSTTGDSGVSGVTGVRGVTDVRDVTGVRGVTDVRDVGCVGVRERYRDDQLVAEIERRRERDFGREDSRTETNESPKHFRTSLPVQPHKPVQPVQGNSEPCDDTPSQCEPPATEPSQPTAREDGQKSVGEATSNTLTGSGGAERHHEPVGVVPSSLLTPSLFPDHLPPTIHFPLRNEPYTPLPKEQRALLKWKIAAITPNLVRHCVARAGFSKCTRGTSWLGYWGKQLTVEAYKSVREYQKVNHFPGTFSIGRKDCLWRNLSRLQARVGKKELNFVPKTYVLPQDLKLLKKDWESSGTKQKWILKPPAAARGIGIRVVSRWNQIPMKRPVIVQRYLADPFLINGSKFDLRVYVYISSYDPLRIYVFKEGLARFATCKYSSAMKHLSNRYMHLTNYSINKRNSEFTPNTDEKVCQGHKWGLLALWRYMRTEMGVDTDAVWQSITDLVIKTIICSEPEVASKTKANVRTPYSVHELFGFDVMLDKRLKPWILEVNVSPSLHSNSPLDVNIKGVLVRDLLNIAGFTIPTPEQLSGEQSPVRYHLTSEERTKTDRSKILDSLTQDDLRVLMQSEDELSRCGEFERVFPCAEYNKYRKFFPVERYYNVLLGEFAAKFHKFPRRGIALLQKQAKLLAKRTSK